MTEQKRPSFFFGEPYAFECPHCGRLILTSVTWGSGAVECPDCKDGTIHFDFISKESLKKNQEKYAEFIKTELEKRNLSTNYDECVLH
jgi:ribosomal protein S27E